MFIQGSSDCTYLKENNVKIWNEWLVKTTQFPDGTIGNLYGPVLRSFRKNKDDAEDTIDQLQRCIDIIKTDPTSRRIRMISFDPRFTADANLTFEENVTNGNGVLSPCHSNFIQFNVSNGYLDMLTVQASADIFLGLPFNFVQAGLLLSMVAQVTNLKPREVIYNIANAHIYENHIDAIMTQVKNESYRLPVLKINPEKTNINDFVFSDFELIDYKNSGSIKASVAI